jgi:peptidoglycan/xylan/chitin deacetylase (PgdA/CDA1 family)
MKICVMSFDDGTVFDKPLIALLRKYHFKATFNLNSGMDGYVWYLGSQPITRLVLKDNIGLYRGMEVASHSLNHPHLSELTWDELGYQIGKDKENLETLFKRPVNAFAVPFSDYDERTIEVLHRLGFTSFRVDADRFDYSFPKDNFIVGVNAYTGEGEGPKKIQDFLNDKNPNGLFIFAGHSYDFEVNQKWACFEEFLKLLSQHPEIKVMTMSEMMKHCPKIE